MKKTLIPASILALTVFMVFAWAQSKPDPLDEKLQGEWKVVAAEAEGTVVPAQNFAKLRVTFAKGKLTMGEENDRPDPYEYKLDGSKSPKQIDLIQRITVISKDSKKSEKTRTKLGILELNGDDLKLCYDEKGESKDRPAAFKSKASTGIVNLELRRVK